MLLFDELFHPFNGSSQRNGGGTRGAGRDTVPFGVGQVFTQACAGYPSWQVEAFYTDCSGVRHVCLRELDNRLDPKTLSISAFLDSGEFISDGSHSASLSISRKRDSSRQGSGFLTGWLKRRTTSTM